MPAAPPVAPHPSGLTPVVERNIAALAERQQQQEHRAGIGERLAGAITRFTGSMTFVCLHLALVGAWVAVNVGWTPLRPFDPTFVGLATVASVEALFLSTFVLISQNRAAAAADARANLDLQVSLLAEHETTRLLRLVAAVAEHLGVEAADTDELAELEQDVAPEKVMDQIEQTEQAEA